MPLREKDDDHPSPLLPLLLFPLSTLLLLPAIASIPTPPSIPTTLPQLAALASDLRAYIDSGLVPALHILAVLSLLTIWKHAWSIPGAVLLNVLAGSLFGSLPAALLLTTLTTIGSILSSLLAAPLSPILASFSPRTVNLTKSIISPTSASPDTTPQPTWIRLSVLRLVGIVPWSAINIACGLCSVPLTDCALGTFIGTLPWTAVTCQIGDLLQFISLSDESVTLNSLLRSPAVVTKLLLLTALSLAPILAKDALKSLINDSASAAEEASTEDEPRGRTHKSIVRRIRDSFSRPRSEKHKEDIEMQ